MNSLSPSRPLALLASIQAAHWTAINPVDLKRTSCRPPVYGTRHHWEIVDVYGNAYACVWYPSMWYKYGMLDRHVSNLNLSCWLDWSKLRTVKCRKLYGTRGKGGTEGACQA